MTLEVCKSSDIEVKVKHKVSAFLPFENSEPLSNIAWGELSEDIIFFGPFVWSLKLSLMLFSIVEGTSDSFFILYILFTHKFPSFVFFSLEGGLNGSSSSSSLEFILVTFISPNIPLACLYSSDTYSSI